VGGDQISEPSKFSDREIEQQRRAATTRKKNLDEERLQLMRDTMQIIQTGTLEQLEEKLTLLGMGRDTQKGRELLHRFISLRGGSLR
jgi:hypothetical protein